MSANDANVDVIGRLFFKQVRNLTLRSKEKEFIDWLSYRRRLDFLDDFLFQQDTRRQNARNVI